LVYSTIYFLLKKLKDREAAGALRHLELPAKVIDAFNGLVPETEKALKILKSPKTNSAKDAYFFLETVLPERLAFLHAEYGDSKAVAKIRNYLQKWRPLRSSMPVAELDSLGVPRGPKFDNILEDFFEAQLRGKGRDPIERTKILKKLAGIKDEPKKEEKKKPKGKDKAEVKAGIAAAQKAGATAPESAAADPKPGKPGIAKTAAGSAPVNAAKKPAPNKSVAKKIAPKKSKARR
jgi:hypothetical protein